jgi:hypothetical protein
MKDKSNKPPFGLNKKESIFDEYIGKYVIIYPYHGSSFVGKLVELKEGYATLNPHQAGYYDKEKGLIRKIIEKDSKVNLMNIVAIEPTTKKNLEASCEYLNKQNQSNK